MSEESDEEYLFLLLLLSFKDFLLLPLTSSSELSSDDEIFPDFLFFPEIKYYRISTLCYIQYVLAREFLHLIYTLALPFSFSIALGILLPSTSPQSTIFTGCKGFPLAVPAFSIFSTTSIPFVTLPKTTCFL